MSTTLKVILGILIGATLVCAVIGAVSFFVLRSTGQMLGQAVQNDPTDVRHVAGLIADYQLPTGFDAGTALDVMGVAFVSHTGEDGRSHIMFFQLPAGVRLDRAEIERQFNQRAEEGAVGKRQAQVVDEVETTICGQQTVMIISEGVSGDGQKFREATVAFDGRGGQALAMYETPENSWDQAAAEAFFASIEK